MTSSQVSIDENGNEWIISSIDNNYSILPNTILGFNDDMRTPSYSHNVFSSNIDNLPSVFNDNDKNAIIADKYIGDLPKNDEKSIAGINDSINESNNETIRSNSLLKTMETKRLITFAKYGNHNKKARPKYSGLTMKQAKYHNELIDVLLENGLYKRIYDKSFNGEIWDFHNIDEDENDLLSKFEFIEPELLHTCYIDTTTPDN